MRLLWSAEVPPCQIDLRSAKIRILVRQLEHMGIQVHSLTIEIIIASWHNFGKAAALA
jgi:hypothetical protein